MFKTVLCWLTIAGLFLNVVAVVLYIALFILERKREKQVDKLFREIVENLDIT